MRTAAERAARFALGVVAGAAAAAVFEGAAAVLQPPWPSRFAAGLATFSAAASAAVLVHLVSVGVLLAIATGVAANDGVRESTRRFGRALVSDAGTAPPVLAAVLGFVAFVVLAGLGFAGVAVWAENGVATPALRAPAVALADLVVVAIAGLAARAVFPPARRLTEGLDARRPGTSRWLLRLGVAAVLAGAIVALVVGWDFVVSLDRRLVSFVAAAIVGLLVARPVMRRARPVSAPARAASLLAPLLVVAGGAQATATLSKTTAAGADARIRSAAAALVLRFVRQRSAIRLVASPRSRIRAAPWLSLPDRVPTPRHVVMLSVDALRADRLGCYGYRKRPTSPVLDRVARKAAVFLEAQVQTTLSLRSIPSILTGLYPHAIPWRRFMPGRVMPEPTAPRPITEILRDRGFRTFANIHTRYVSNEWILGGFDEVVEDPPRRYTPAMSRELRADRFVAKTIDRLTARPVGDERLFLWMHLIEPHEPYNPVPGFAWGDSDSEHYDAEVRYTDRALGRFLEFLDRSGIARDALFVFFSDHGEEFGEHGLGGHGRSLYRAGTRVPLLFWGVGVRPGRWETAVGLMDVVPTVLGMLRIRPPHVHGASLVRTLTAGESPPERTVGSELFPTGVGPPYRWAGQRDGWKLVTEHDLEPLELYDIDEDPEESTNLLVARPAVREALRRDLAAVRELRAQPVRRRR